MRLLLKRPPNRRFAALSAQRHAARPKLGQGGQPHTCEEGGDIRVVIRQIIERGDEN
jgi:hypothetical protein